jgi:hypothetical protein
LNFPLIQQIPETPLKKDSLIAEEIDGESEVIYVDADTGSSYSLNVTAAVVLDLCNGERAQQDIVDVITGTVDSSEAIVAKDVQSTLEEFMVLGLIH